MKKLIAGLVSRPQYEIIIYLALSIQKYKKKPQNISFLIALDQESSKDKHFCLKN